MHQKRPMHIKRDLYTSKETYIHQKRPIYIKRGNTLQQHTAAHCSTLQHTATHCNKQHTAATWCSALQHTEHTAATHCSTLQHTATHCNTLLVLHELGCFHMKLWVRDTLQHTATHCNTLQHIACAAWNGLFPHETVFLWLFIYGCSYESVSSWHTATHCNTLQHTATHCCFLMKRYFCDCLLVSFDVYWSLFIVYRSLLMCTGLF